MSSTRSNRYGSVRRSWCDARAQYDSPAAWDTIVLEVVDGLRREAP